MVPVGHLLYAAAGIRTSEPRPTADTSAKPMLRLRAGGLGAPFDEGGGGVVLKVAVLVGEDGVDEATHGLGGGEPVGEGVVDEVAEPFGAEVLTCFGARFGDAVGVQQDAVAGLQGLLGDGGNGV